MRRLPSLSTRRSHDFVVVCLLITIVADLWNSDIGILPNALWSTSIIAADLWNSDIGILPNGLWSTSLIAADLWNSNIGILRTAFGAPALLRRTTASLLVALPSFRAASGLRWTFGTASLPSFRTAFGAPASLPRTTVSLLALRFFQAALLAALRSFPGPIASVGTFMFIPVVWSGASDPNNAATLLSSCREGWARCGINLARILRILRGILELGATVQRR